MTMAREAIAVADELEMLRAENAALKAERWLPVEDGFDTCVPARRVRAMKICSGYSVRKAMDWTLKTETTKWPDTLYCPTIYVYANVRHPMQREPADTLLHYLNLVHPDTPTDTPANQYRAGWCMPDARRSLQVGR